MGFTPAANASSTLSKRKGSKRRRRSHWSFLFFIREVIAIQVEPCCRITCNGCSVTIRWTHKGVKGIEVADGCAAEAPHDRVSSSTEGRQASPPYSRITNESRLSDTREWIRSHVKPAKKFDMYRPSRVRKIRKALQRGGRQWSVGSTNVSSFPATQQMQLAQSDACWWCGSHERQ